MKVFLVYLDGAGWVAVVVANQTQTMFLNRLSCGSFQRSKLDAERLARDFLNNPEDILGYCPEPPERYLDCSGAYQISEDGWSPGACPPLEDCYSGA